MAALAFTSRSAEDTRDLGRALAMALQPDDVVTLTGDLGAGKTRLTQGVATGLGVAEAVTSPTFNILLEHRGSLTLYHFDLYRLERADQLEDIAFWETLEAGGVSMIEWGERFPEALPDDHLAVVITIEPDGSRRLVPEARGERAAQLLARWESAAGRMGVGS
ncbi:MAG: tRNA (adenosine(37)-N6)-threonylcarbamoyltransferase complex ATPase subunit type 1 TsaE [Coriobacteriia bacterium]